jgi:hypothetical protein
VVAALGVRPIEAVKELEALQQNERAAAGEPLLTPEDFQRQLKENIHQRIVSDRLDRLDRQRTGNLDAVIRATVGTEQQAEEEYAAQLHAWHLDDPSQWSRYELPNIRYDIARICASIEAIFARFDWPLSRYPVVGTLTTGRESATTQPTSTGAPLILIDNGFFKFAVIMSQLAIFAPYDARYKRGFSTATLQLVSDLVATHTVLNTCLFTYPRKVPAEFQSRVANFQWAMGVFVIAHEYAHVSAGDYNAHPSAPTRQDDSRHAKELRADRIGFIATVEVMQERNEGADGVFGPFLYLAGLDLLARAAAAYEGRPPPALTDPDYPTPYERTVSLLEWLQTSDYRKQFGDQIGHASACYNTILFVWDEIMPAFMAARDELSEFDPAREGGQVGGYPLGEARVFGLVQTLWRHVLASRPALEKRDGLRAFFSGLRGLFRGQ